MSNPRSRRSWKSLERATSSYSRMTPMPDEHEHDRNGNPNGRASGSPSSHATNGLRAVFDDERQDTSQAEPTPGRRVEILLDDELYDRVRIKAMRQRKSLRSLGAELFVAWANDESASGGR